MLRCIAPPRADVLDINSKGNIYSGVEPGYESFKHMILLGALKLFLSSKIRVGQLQGIFKDQVHLSDLFMANWKLKHII